MSFGSPELFLLLILIPLIVAGALMTWRKRGKRWHRLVAQRLQSILVRERPKRRRWIAFGVLLLAFLLLIIALAAPNAGYQEAQETIRGRNFLIAVDVSRSMLATDEAPNRLAAARASALEMLDRFPHDRFGIIAFSGSAWVQAPLTVDHAALRDVLQQLQGRGDGRDWIPRSGSDLGAAVRLAIKVFRETGQRSNALIILSDGETHQGGVEQAAREAERSGLTIFSAGFGTDVGAFIPDPNSRDKRFHDRDGNLVLTRLETEPLLRLARETKGIYTSGAGKEFLSKLEVGVQRLERFELEGRKHRVAIPRFQWFLAPSMLLFVVGILLNTSWRFPAAKARPATAVLAVLFMLAPHSDAGLIPRTRAERAFSAGDHRRALELFEGEVAQAHGERKARLQLGGAAAAYRLKEFTLASQAYSGALLSTNPEVQEQAHFGLGNTQFYKGNLLQKGASSKRSGPENIEATALFWRDAIGHFEGALSLNAENSQAKDNRDLVQSLLDELLKKQAKEESPQGAPNEPDPQGDDPESDPKNNDSKDQQGKGEHESNSPKPGQDPNNENPPEENPSKPPERDPEEGGQEESESKSSIKPRPDESPEDYARRILNSNADFDMKPMPRRIRTPHRPKKDW
jgi:Ca-activated chloride channel family protein